ncbi:hypothetical protein [Streptomyces lavendulae]
MIERVRAVLVTADDTMLVIRRAKPDIVRLLHTMESDDERQLFYLARIVTWSFEDRTGPEFSAEGRGEYALEEVPLTVEGSDVPALVPLRHPAPLQQGAGNRQLSGMVVAAPTGVVVVGRSAMQRCFSVSVIGPVRCMRRSGTARDGPSMAACRRWSSLLLTNQPSTRSLLGRSSPQLTSPGMIFS